MNNKFIDTVELNDEWEIETEDGWKDISHIHKTKKFKVWEIRTSEFSLKCADEHIVIGNNFQNIYVKDLKIGTEIVTKNGIQKITYIHKSEIEENMYDITVKSEKHTFFSNGILSHNTTVATVYLLHYALFEEDKTVAILANKESTAIEILSRLKLAYTELPIWLQRGISEQNGGWAKKAVGLENGIKIIAGSTASSAIRGMSAGLVFLDEFAFVPDNIADDFMSSVYPTIASGKKAKIIIVSTPNGMNHFYDIYRKATRGENNFMPIKIRWDEVPGRDDKWREEIIRDIGPAKWNQEFGTQFLGSSNTLIDTSMLERMNTKNPVEVKMGSYLSIYEQPIDGAMYILGVDSAKGTRKDYSVIQVIKIISERDIEQVALYRDNTIEPRDYAQVIISVSKFYNDAYIMLENNDVGETVANTIWYEYEYDKILNCDKKGIGIRSTRKTKLAANMLLKRYIENGWLEIIDKFTLFELSRYEEESPNVFQAPRGQNDDCVTSMLWALFFLTTVFFDGKNLNVKQIDDKFLIQKMEEEDTTSPVAITPDDEENISDEDGDWSSGFSNDPFESNRNKQTVEKRTDNVDKDDDELFSNDPFDI
jgi:hypothetical protein